MRKSLITAALAATIISTAALAASISDVGTIKVLDQSKHQLTLADGKIFSLPATWSATGFKVGDKVKVTYQLENGKMMASTVERAS